MGFFERELADKIKDQSKKMGNCPIKPTFHLPLSVDLNALSPFALEASTSVNLSYGFFFIYHNNNANLIRRTLLPCANLNKMLF